MTSVRLDAAKVAREIDDLLDELVAAWNRADTASRPVLPFPALLPNASLAIEWRRMTWVCADLVSVHVGWTVRAYPGPAEGPAERRGGVGSLAVAREGRGWVIAAADPARVPAAVPEGPGPGRAGMLPRPGSGSTLTACAAASRHCESPTPSR